MAERRNSLASYSLTDTLAKERPQPDCYVVDVNFQEGDVPNSLAHITELVESFTAHGRDRTTSITKLYIIGEWRPVFVTEEDTDENRNAVPLLQREWEAANGELAKLITRIPTLKQLTYYLPQTTTLICRMMLIVLQMDFRITFHGLCLGCFEQLVDETHH